MLSIETLFYFFSALMLVSAVGVISSKNPVRAVLSLVLTFIGAAGLWLLIQAEFLAIALVLVYVGAVMVLFLFVVMMLDIKITSLQGGFTSYFIAGIGFSTFAVYIILRYLDISRFGSDNFAAPEALSIHYSNTKALGLEIFNRYILAFELAGVLLLVAIVAAIALTFRGRANRKGQSPALQVQAKKSDRLKIISMPAEKE